MGRVVSRPVEPLFQLKGIKVFLTLTSFEILNSLGRFRSVGVVMMSSTGKTLKLEIHPLHSVFEQHYYVYPDAAMKVVEGKKKSATIYAIVEEGSNEG